MKRILVLALLIVGLFYGASGYAEFVYRPGATVRVSYQSVLSQSTTSAIGSFIRTVRLLCTTDCFVAIAATGTPALIATTSTGILLIANTPEYFNVSGGQHFAVIASGVTGNLFITELTQ